MNTKDYHSLMDQIGEGVQLIAISKKQPMVSIQKLYDKGHRSFGENYVQELCSKKEKLPLDIAWHFVGHLQTNKVKSIAPFVHCIQSVDSIKLVEVIDRQAARHQRCIDVLVQVHVAEEPSKYGVLPPSCVDFVREVVFQHTFKNVCLRGLMGMSTNTRDESTVKREFRLLKKLFDEVLVAISSSPSSLSWDTLSMGMSGDYQIAIEEGSNMIRIGSLLFGGRS